MPNFKREHPITVKEVHELRILQVISRLDRPVGSRVLRQQLLQHGIDFSEATAGRWLSELSGLGLLEDHGKQGRTLSPTGESRLLKLEQQDESWSHVNDLLQIYKAADPEYLIDLLKARRLIEPEIARLAALRANKNDLKRITATLEAREQLLQTMPTDSTEAEERERFILAETDANFHLAVSESAHSPALAAALRLLKSAEPYFPVFIEMRRSLRSRGFKEHNDIALAIFQRDEARARDLMYEHISEVLNDISRYTSGH
ncbi:FadR/GntR family transcriptional regulator [Alicyclobacillus sp. ALC3]|uniref:FadR/GntR family transcriptional regulator n=1 Tax=Alicyclobacillus sp. ALC3 TaxID=2796143 RepID=UPI002378FA00|nr:FCD domain-containing protein [Alicyclobacillus sp. ALC3]WDL98549.1 FadR family transcriptional regulator [Alicyclobacillus sp. ALC3]